MDDLMPKRNRTSANQIQLRKRRAQAVALREKDISYREIATQLGVTVGGAYKLVKAGIAELQPIEDAKIARQLKLTRLDHLCMVYYAKAQGGDDVAAKVYLSLDSEHSKLAGLYPQPGAAAVNVDASVHRTLNIVGLPALEHNMGPLPPADAPRPMNRSELGDERYPHKLDATPSASDQPLRRDSTKTTQPPPENTPGPGGRVVINGAVADGWGNMMRRKW